MPADAALTGVLAGVLTGSRLGVLLVSPEGVLHWHNAAAALMLEGQADAALQGRLLASFFQDDAPQQQALATVLAGLAPGATPSPGAELPLKRHPRWLRLDAQGIGADLHAGAGLAGAISLSDVTTQRRERLDADREGTLLRQAAHLARIGAWSFEPSEFRVRWSDEIFAIHELPLGRSPDPLQALDYFEKGSRQRLREAIELAMAQGTAFDLSLGLITANGQAKRVRTIGSAERDENGRVVRVAGLFHDITEREQHAQALLDKAAAEQASRAKSDFLSRVSHELRTPLNGVLGFAQLLQHRAGDLPGWTAEPLRLIRQAGDHLLTLIDDMLHLGTVESGAPPLTLAPVSLDAVVGEALRLVAPQALAAGVALRPWGPSPAWVLADVTRLRQILLNLLCNAIKYNRAGGDVRLLLDSDAAQWTLRVVDSGPGISAQRRLELFQPFNRLGAETGLMPGSGLGLTIARHLTQAMGGQLELAPPGPGGAELRVSLQRAEPAADAPAPAGSPLAEAGVPGVCRVLYVEDHPVNAMLVSEALALQQPRHQLRVAETGEEGLEMVAAERPDIVLLDLNLPGADGYEVLARLRAHPAWAGMPCVAVSADAMPEELARARAAGFDDYWTKPLTMVGLADRIAAIVAGTAATGG
ncbi:hybrid sensor histidine kinase/response regulator [Aquabacterium sp.]|uniref:hybrid sensor histidine kinase/response regulator n=1 Tax=Aquabacterium sp. TaxID=1872578 RepID=UPI002B7F9655|nr:response regulator [Aquabacterium sp.]HSW04221.1 response regulator [Aquabacterium sp.]